MVHCLSGQRDFRYVWGCSNIRNERLTWAEPPSALLSCCSIIIFILCSCWSVLGWDESRNLKFRERDRIHFWHSIPFLTLSAGKDKKASWYESEFYFCSQDSEFILVSGAWFKRKYLEARSLQWTSVWKDALSSSVYVFFTAVLEKTPAKIVHFLSKCNSFP